MARKPIEPGEFVPLAIPAANGFSTTFNQADVEGFLSQRLPAIALQIPQDAVRRQIHVTEEGEVIIFTANGQRESRSLVEAWVRENMVPGSIVDAYLSESEGIITDVLYWKRDIRDLDAALRLSMVEMIDKEGKIFIKDQNLSTLETVLFPEGVDRLLIKPANDPYPQSNQELNWLIVSKGEDLELDPTQTIIAKIYGLEPEYPSVEVKILKAEVEEEKRLVYGIVMRPNIIDGHLDLISEREVEKAAHFYMMVRGFGAGIMGEVHTEEAEAVPVESYIAPVDFEMGNGEVKKGDWVLVSYVVSDDLWARIQSGEVNGYSPGGLGNKREIQI